MLDYNTLFPGPAPPWKCPFTEDIGYLVFSSTVSFYGPLAVMVFTYIKIYQVSTGQAEIESIYTN